MSTTARQDMLITDLFDTITTFNCLTHEDISNNSRLLSISDVGNVLSWIRRPDVSVEYGWTVPHVRRGRPAATEDYRYMVVGLSGEVLDADGIRIVRAGALSTMRMVHSETRNLANALRLTIPMVTDQQYRRQARDMSTVLEGFSVQADLEAQRLEALLITP